MSKHVTWVVLNDNFQKILWKYFQKKLSKNPNHPPISSFHTERVLITNFYTHVQARDHVFENKGYSHATHIVEWSAVLSLR